MLIESFHPNMNTLLKSGITVILLLAFHTSFSQKNTMTITGQILDSKTSEPIAFASVYIQSQLIGTTSNEEGYFVFSYSNRK